METIVGYCGLVCTDCPAYRATQANDRAALEKTAASWSEAFDAADFSPDAILCDGCLAPDDGRLCAYCATCAIRACATMRPQHIANCAHCVEYARQGEVCAKLAPLFADAPDAQATLDEVKQHLQEEARQAAQ
jgi:Protein of unknown function (DUF3795)